MTLNKTAPYIHARQPAIFQRLNKLAPKGIGQLTTLRNSSGLITTTKEVEQEVRATRGFWTEPPPELAKNLQDLVREYARTSQPFQHMSSPDRNLYVEVILGTGDTATGSDGAPYALLRMAPRTVADILQQLLLQIMTDPDPVRPPMPLLAWISKATAGLSADNWRPLGMPTVFLRVLAAVFFRHIVLHNPKLLHSAQALLHDFREP